MQGKVIQVSVSQGGVPKNALLEGNLTTDGFVGDSWRYPKFHGGPLQAVLLISIEVLEQLKGLGFPVFPGALGENVTTEGINFANLRYGDQLQLGEAIIEITKRRTPCDTLSVYGQGIQKAIFDAKAKANDPTSPHWGHAGFYAKVLKPGIIRPHDIITVEPRDVSEDPAA